MKYKRLCSKYMIMLFAILVSIQAVSAAPTVDVESQYPNVSQGETFTVNITINPDGTEIFGAQYSLFFNNSLLKALNQNKGLLLSQDGTSTIDIKNTIDNSTGIIEYGEMRTGVKNGVTTKGILATIEFEVIGSGVDEFRLFNVKLSDPNADPIPGIIVQSKPSIPFNIQGYVFYEDGSNCTNFTGSITNKNLNMQYSVNLINSTNYYKNMLVSDVDIIAGDVLQFNIVSPDGKQSKVTDHTVTQDEIDNHGIFNFNITLKPDTTPVQSTSSGSSGGSSGGGGGTSGEAFANIIVSETKREYVNSGLKVSYRFDSESNVIQYINFTGVTSSGEVAARVEVLKNISILADHAPSDPVYKNINIWVGNSGWANSKNIANPTIKFKVEKPWVRENNIDKSTIQLNQYTEKTWNPLTTNGVGEDENYLYFEAETTGFSPFAITGRQIAASSSPDESEATSAAGSRHMDEDSNQITDTPPDQTSSKKIPSFSLYTGALILLVAVYILRKES